MRKQLLGLILPLLAFVLIAAAADMPGKGPAATSALQRVEVARGPDGLLVEFTAKGAVAPKVETLDSPARIVINLPNTVMATAQSHISVGSNGVKGVRVGMDGQLPPTTRVVVDLAAACSHELVAGKDGHYTLKIQGTELAHKGAAPIAKPAASSPAPKLVLASAPVATAPVTTSVPAAPVAAEKTAKPAVDFAFVEPKYAATTEKAMAAALTS